MALIETRPAARPPALVLAAALAIGGAACVKPTLDASAPADLGRALGAGGYAPGGEEAAGLETLTHDLNPLLEAGVTDAGEVALAIARRLVGTTREPQRVELRGTHLVVRHTPANVALVREVLEAMAADRLDPIHLDVHLVEGPAELADRDGEALVQAIAAARRGGGTRTLARQRLRLTNGRWSGVVAERAAWPVLHVRKDGSSPAEVQSRRADGLTLQAAVWRAPGGRSGVLHLEATVQEPQETRRAEATYHPAPRDRTVEVEAGVDLPVLRTAAVRGQALLARGAWERLAVAPSSEPGRVLIALARIDWAGARPLALDGTLPPSRAAALIPVALPESAAGPGPELAAGLAWSRSGAGEAEAGFDTMRIQLALRDEANRQGAVVNRIVNDIGGAGGFIVLEAPEEQGLAAVWKPRLPPDLEARRGALARVRWDGSTALLLRWDLALAIHEPGTVGEIERLLADVQAWRSEAVRVRVEPVALAPATALALPPSGRLSGAQVEEARAAATSPAFEVVGRSGAWSEVAALQHRAALWGFLGPDRESPPIRFLPHGARLSILPRRYGSGRTEIDLRFVVDSVDAESLSASPNAGGIVHPARAARREIRRIVALERGESILLLGGADAAPGEPGLVRGVLVTLAE